MPVKVAVCQVPDIRENIRVATGWIENFAEQAEADGVSLLCFPECFLQGYLTEERTAGNHAISLDSSVFKLLLAQLSAFKPVLVIGMIEEENKNLFNTAVIIKEGQLLGRYRKTHLLPGEQIFRAGNEYPVFETEGLKFGINICYDTQFPEAASCLAQQGAKLILCPSNNMMKREKAEKYRELHHEVRIKRARENKIWLLSSDVTGSREDRIAYGPSSAINPAGKVTVRVPLMETGMVSAEI